MAKAKLIFIGLFSSGWLAPLYFAYSLYTAYLENMLQRHEDFSLSFLQVSEKLFLCTCIWLAAVIIFWWLAIGKKIFNPDVNKSPFDSKS